jgi:23S rRNA (cytosine1962-C5)-methyltransferase
MTRPVINPEPTLCRTDGWENFALLDSGGGRKLERYGTLRIVRPEPQCLWKQRLDKEAWDDADAVFDPAAGEEDSGRWRFSRDHPESWPLSWGKVEFYGRFTPFRHLGFFPEQAANWAWLEARIEASGKPLKILNLFGYTGVASLVCAAAGAEVTHVDASKKAIGFARENAALSGLEGAPIRWICEDARKYVAREVRRGNRYDGIILDPPKYGRGPGGEVWKLYDDLPGLMGDCVGLLSDNPSFLLLNAYAERISGLSLASLTADLLEGRAGTIDWGELALMEQGGTRGAGLSFFARWTP